LSNSHCLFCLSPSLYLSLKMLSRAQLVLPALARFFLNFPLVARPLATERRNFAAIVEMWAESLTSVCGHGAKDLHMPTGLGRDGRACLQAIWPCTPQNQCTHTWHTPCAHTMRARACQCHTERASCLVHAAGLTPYIYIYIYIYIFVSVFFLIFCFSGAPRPAKLS
jgi:hypothetical protein